MKTETKPSLEYAKLKMFCHIMINYLLAKDSHELQKMLEYVNSPEGEKKAMEHY